jgi:iron complex transport system ATP-binding protein
MLDISGLHVTLGKSEILHGVDLAVAKGEWVTVIGPNGAGKSTLLRAVGGSLPYDGSIAIAGTQTSALPRRRRAQLVATVAQHPVVPPGMRVLDYVLLGRTPYVAPLGRESERDVSIARQRLAELDLIHFGDRELETLSGGERQRAFLSRALAQDAPLLLLDEPTTALDIGHQQEVLELVDGLRREHGLTVLATMHDLSVAGRVRRPACAPRLRLGSRRRRARTVLTEDLLHEHYRARVRVIKGEHGPVVVPIR